LSGDIKEPIVFFDQLSIRISGIMSGVAYLCVSKACLHVSLHWNMCG